MTDAERREAARLFYNKWNGKGKEDEDDRSFWIDFLQDVMGMEHVTDRIEFQKKVLNDKGNLSNRIDAYIPETRVLIEQKSLGIDLSKPQPQHNNKTPYQQAKDYDNALPLSEKAKWIILSNFSEIWVYDMDTRVPEPEKYLLSEIQTKYSLFDFLINKEEKKLSKEVEVSVQAGEFVGLIYDALLKQYINPKSEESLKSLNMLCVRLVFCLYAEDAHIFGDNGHMFHDYMDGFETKDMRRALIDLFKILDTPEEDRDPYDDSELSKFPYVNGGLFANEDIEIPRFTDEIREILLAKASEGFDWSMISPTIFGAVFESTLNPETRRSGGMHYTSVENIHKVIDPLFLDELIEEYESIEKTKVVKTKKDKLDKFQNKLAKLKWLDPACGSGNFLTETYISVRRLENKVIRSILDCKKGAVDGQIIMGEVVNPIKVKIDQFYGIEVNDFAVTVAKTALWIAESQMMKETENIIMMSLDFLPLRTNACIVEGNALRIDWEDVVPKSKLNYIMGNPPFVGTKWMNKEQKEDTETIFNGIKKYGVLDYVACWYKKASDYMINTIIESSFVSTNSITQGEQVTPLWKSLENIFINFAHKTFVWNSEANEKASVHCVIIGFSYVEKKEKYLYDDNKIMLVNKINGYLHPNENIFIEARKKPICNCAPIISKGSQPTDGGNLLLTEEEKKDFLNKYPSFSKYIKRYMGAFDFLNNQYRFCFWLKECPPSMIRQSPELVARLNAVKESRKKSTKKSTQNWANKPFLFTEDRQPNKDYIFLPVVSSERRRYMPIGWVDKNVIANTNAQMISEASIYDFGILMSNVHNAWMRTICGRMKSDYAYSATIVYNNFPWPTPTDEQKTRIGQTAQGILDARKLYPDSSLADLYDPLTMPPELQKAHRDNDRAVMKAYGFDITNTSEADCVASLMKMYQELTKGK